MRAVGEVRLPKAQIGFPMFVQVRCCRKASMSVMQIQRAALFDIDEQPHIFPASINKPLAQLPHQSTRIAQGNSLLEMLVTPALIILGAAERLGAKYLSTK